MIRKVFTAAIISGLFLASCNGESKKDSKETTATETTVKEEIVADSIINEDGSKLGMAFNNSKNTATVLLNGEEIELEGQKAASGIWYKNDHYELRGKGRDLELTKDDKVVFKHKDDVVESTVIDKTGKKLQMSFNNTLNKATFLLDGETIHLKGDTTGSGIQYSNKNYVYTEHQGNMELKKDGKIVFEIKK
ncbi:MliC family protein [Pedobacter punctiformis]|uniref:MliC family protein n=1 Tax=Pedobacter punctiformis TaxID=3004097 RepID=A0ABT4LBX9_9SPHI|nr:MliC family protein [Pedobacter sp. HCMS5-2]MCZ4244653.1 MliC family protein [Pedobacter sp. HCMS5-2]